MLQYIDLLNLIFSPSCKGSVRHQTQTASNWLLPTMGPTAIRIPCHCSQQPLELHRLQRGGNQGVFLEDSPKMVTSTFTNINESSVIHPSIHDPWSMLHHHYHHYHHPSSLSSFIHHHVTIIIIIIIIISAPLLIPLDPLASLMHQIRSTANQTYPPATSSPPWLEGIRGTASAVEICSNISSVCCWLGFRFNLNPNKQLVKPQA